MARFIGNMQGQRGEASRLGSTKSGIQAHIRGWNIGIKVNGYVDDKGNDLFEVYLTSGSNGRKNGKLIGTFTEFSLD